MENVPMPVFSGTTALVLFAIYLRLRGRLTNLQMVIGILVALMIGYAIYNIQASAGSVTPNSVI